MRIIKPSWINHLDDKKVPQTVFSLHVHPDGSRLATGSLLNVIKIWATEPVLDEEKEKAGEEACPRLLSTMEGHDGAVLCVRWSWKGNFLASSSDDSIVKIWYKAPGVSKVFGSDKANIEDWKHWQRLAGHTSDVTGVAWSEDDWCLASVGLDSLVLIWDTECWQLLRRLDLHQGFVKGVVWDPAGQYLATQSDDRSVKIWRTTDWACEADITEPFINCPTSTFFRRLSWSPDGTHITTPNSMNGPVFVSAVIDRYKWRSTISLVGHQNVVEVAAFNPLVFLRDPTRPADGVNLCTILALAARNSVSVWQTSSSKPVVVLHDLFDRDILDLSWSFDGRTLYACSSEGGVAALHFDLNEFTKVAPPHAKFDYHRSFNFTKGPRQHPYGYIPTQGHHGPPTCALQPYRSGSSHRQLQPEASRSSTPSKQEITLLPNGKRRIKPTLVGPDGEQLPLPPPQGNGVHHPMQAPAQIPGAGLGPSPYAPRGPPQLQHQSHPQHTSHHLPQPKHGFSHHAPSSTYPTPPHQAHQAAGMNGHSVPGPYGGYDPPPGYPHSAPPPSASYAIDHMGRTLPVQPHLASPQQPVAGPSGTWAAPQGSGAQPLAGTARSQGQSQNLSQNSRKRRATDPMDLDADAREEDGGHPLTPRLSRLKGRTLGGDRVREGEPLQTQMAPAYVMLPEEEVFQKRKVERGRAECLAVPAVLSYAEYRCGPLGPGAGGEEVDVFEYRNFEEDGKPSEVAMLDGARKRTLWVDYLPSRVLNGAASTTFEAVGCEDGTLHVYTQTGRRALPPMKLDAPCAFLVSNAHMLMVITARGTIKVWDLKLGKALFQPISASEVLSCSASACSRVPSVAHASVTVNGCPVIGLTNGEAYTYDHTLQAWALLSHPWWEKGSNAWESRRSRASAAGRGPVRHAESVTADILLAEATELISSSPAAGDGETKAAIEGETKPQLGRKEDFSLALTLGHLESRMAAAVLLDSPAEYKAFLVQYAKVLNEEGFRSKAEEVCKELLGPVYHDSPKAATWQKTVVGLNKRELLKDVLAVFAKGKSLVKLSQDYSDILRNIAAG